MQDSIFLPQRKVFIVHGLMSACKREFRRKFDFKKVKCVETGAYLKSLEPIENQAKRLCTYFTKLNKEDPDILKSGIYIFAMSQGGIITRYALHTCKFLRSITKRVVFSGVPHIGVKKIPDSAAWNTFKDDQVENIFDILSDKNNWYFPWKSKVKYSKRISVTQYLVLKKKGEIIEYMEGDNFGPEKLDKINFILNIVWNKDTVVDPPSSTAFGAKYEFNANQMSSFTDTNYFKTNKFGLKDKYLKGKFVNCLADGTHNEYKNHINEVMEYFNDDCEFKKSIFGNNSTDELYQFCLYKKINDIASQKSKNNLCIQYDPELNLVVKNSVVSSSTISDIKKLI